MEFWTDIGKRFWTMWLSAVVTFRGSQHTSEWDAFQRWFAEGNFSAAENHAFQILQRKERTRGLDHPQVATALLYLADARMALGSYNAAKLALDKSLTIRQTHFGEHRVETVTTRLRLAKWYELTGSINQAEEIYHGLLTTLTEVLGRQDPGLAVVYNRLSGLQLRGRRFDEAEDTATQAVKLAKQASGDSAEVVAGLSNLASALKGLNQSELATERYSQALAESKKVYGVDSLQTAKCLTNIAAMHWQSGDLDHAIKLTKEALNIRLNHQGPKHVDYAEDRALLGQLRCGEGSYDTGIDLVDQALKVFEAALGVTHPRYQELQKKRGDLIKQKHAATRGKGVLVQKEFILQQLELTPAHVNVLLREFPPERLNRKWGPSLLSARQHVLELANLQRTAIDNLDKMLATPGIEISERSAGDCKVPGDVEIKEINKYFQNFLADRRGLIERLKQLSEEQWLIHGEQVGQTRWSILIMIRQLSLREMCHVDSIERCLLSQ